jgi:hypothetical protein
MAVLCTQLTSVILGAMEQTEPYARSAKLLSNAPIVRYTLLEKPMSWWTTLLYGTQRKRHGESRSRVIVAACLV